MPSSRDDEYKGATSSWTLSSSSSSSSSSSTAVTQLADTRKLCLFLVGCFSHTFDKIGKKFDAPELVEFMNAVRGLTNKSNVAQRLFCTLAPDGIDPQSA